ncbi:HNH endonuclease family protein [Streptomyces sp. TR02-1]|uniref:HNH endonuclease family protein n=1 Tax=Streptomyces sp. TR02-1 TaxID=3385977 RepID=UPI0039A1391F
MSALTTPRAFAAFLVLLLFPFANSPAYAGTGGRTLPLRDAVAALPLSAEDRTGYDRVSSYGRWIDIDKDGCRTRSEVLLEEAVVAPSRTGRCRLSGGRWFSWYDGSVVDGPRGLDIDHVVPLAESWDSGASAWTRERRSAYANYLDDPRHLVAVTARSNRQKADRDPADWMPADPVQCRYAADWTAVKLSWGLSADMAEREALAGVAASCPNLPVRYAPAP